MLRTFPVSNLLNPLLKGSASRRRAPRNGRAAGHRPLPASGRAAAAHRRGLHVRRPTHPTAPRRSADRHEPHERMLKSYIRSPWTICPGHDDRFEHSYIFWERQAVERLSKATFRAVQPAARCTGYRLRRTSSAAHQHGSRDRPCVECSAALPVGS